MSDALYLSTLEEQLAVDNHGVVKKSLLTELATAQLEIKKQLDAGVSKSRYSQLSAYKQALESAQYTIDTLWHTFHSSSSQQG